MKLIFNTYSTCCFMFSLSGFGTAPSFTLLNNDDIAKALDFVRTKLLERLNEAIEDDANNQNILVYFYGKFYSSNPKEFEFQPGDLRLIENLVTHVKQTINCPEGKKDGFKHFKRKKCARINKDLVETPVGQFFGDIASAQHRLNTNESENQLTKTDSELLYLLQQTITGKLNENGYDDDTIAKFNGKVGINSKNGRKVSGYVNCAICCEEKNLEKKHISLYFDETYWLLSNFVTHLKRCHSLHSTPNENKQREKNQKRKYHPAKKLTVKPNQN